MRLMTCRQLAAAVVACLFTPVLAGAEVPHLPSCGRAVVKHDDALYFPDATFTVEAWVRPEVRGHWQRIVSKYGNAFRGKEDHSMRAWEMTLKDTGTLFFRAVPASDEGTAPYTGEAPGTVALYHFDERKPGGVLPNAASPDRHQALLLDGDLPALAPSMPGFGQALRLTGKTQTGIPLKPYPFKQLPHPSLEKLGKLGQRWQERYTDRVRAEVLGHVSDGLPVHLLTITDFTQPDDDKEVVLLAGMHVGGEISGGMALLAFAEWLIGDDPLAQQTRGKQVCVLVPVANPHGYAKGPHNKAKHDPAWCWSAEGATHQEENPEGVLIQQLVDRLQPEVFVDSHGTSLIGQYMGEFQGTSGYSLLLNTFQQSLVRELARAAGEVGFPQHLGSESYEKVIVSEAVPGSPHAFFVYPVNAPLYACLRYHTIPLPMESGGWTGSAVARLKRLMKIGCERWPTEPYPGHPNRRVSSPTTWMQCLAAYGQTAAERRRSRVELWQKQVQLVRFGSYPDMDRGFMYGVATDPEAAQKLFRGSRGDSPTIAPGRFLLNLPSTRHAYRSTDT